MSAFQVSRSLVLDLGKGSFATTHESRRSLNIGEAPIAQGLRSKITQTE